MQALELVVAGLEIFPRHGDDVGERAGIVGRELREYRVSGRQKPARAGEVRHVGMELPGEDRETVEPIDLGALDLRIPVCALDEADHEAVPAPPREVDDDVQHGERALLIGLYDEAKPVPAGKTLVRRQGFEEMEGEVEPVGLLGIDVEPDIVAAGREGEVRQPRQQLVHHPLALGTGIARVQR